jgi:poly(3-hydroxybutyrate) depolymerase
MRTRNFSKRLLLVAFFGMFVWGCGDSTGGGSSLGGSTSGSASSGGSSGASSALPTGGSVGSDGTTTPATGGSSTAVTSSASAGRASGGTSSAGGTPPPSGGSVTGGTSSPATGGRASGGAPGTGGSIPATGGSVTGGSSSPLGGNSGRGGSAAGGGSGGRAAGGSSIGAGGTPTGGVAAGGSTAPGTDAVKSPGCGTTTTAKSGNNQTLGSRTYNLKIPTDYDSSKAYRLIVSIHWLNGTAANVSDGSGTAKAWYNLWDMANPSTGSTTIFVSPQGLNNGWSNSGGADVTFIKSLVTQLESQLCIDTTRIFAEGFSMGGSMSYALASAAPEMFRGVAVHSGGSMSGSTNGHSKPVAYFMTHGIKDSVCTYPGFGVPQLQDFAKVNGCTKPDPTLSATAFEAALPEPTSTASACVDFTGCKDGFPVRSCLFVGDHTPSPDGTSGWVPKETWKFFSQF